MESGLQGGPGAFSKNTGSAALAISPRSPHEPEARLRASSTRYGDMRDRLFRMTNVRIFCTTAPHIAALMRATGEGERGPYVFCFATGTGIPATFSFTEASWLRLVK
jgi:hypothetical protein